MVYDKEKQKEYETRNKDRIRETKRLYRLRNIEHIKENAQRYYLENKEILCKKKSDYYFKNKDWRNKNKSKNTKDRRKIDKNYASALRLRSLFRVALINYGDGKSFSSKKYGIDYKAIIEYLKPFPKNIERYHIDHIKPLCSFDLTNQEEIKKAFAPENHRWLLSSENLRKAGEDRKLSLKLNNKIGSL